MNAMQITGKVAKVDRDKFLVFGWASVATDANGNSVVDSQGDVIDIADLEKAAYSFVLSDGYGSEMHTGRHAARLVESIVFTDDKIAALGLEGQIPRGWWCGFKVHDAEAWQKIKNGEYSMFSIGGRATREACKDESA